MAKTTEAGWDEYLSSGEGIVTEYSMGGYNILITTQRLICLKKFPKSFSEARYEDIHSLSHSTPFLWARFSKGIIFLALAGYMYLQSPFRGKSLLSDMLSNILEKLPELSFLPVDGTVKLVVVAIFAYGLYDILKFLPSTRGLLKITLKQKAPLKIHTPLKPQTKEMIKTIEGLIAAREEIVHPEPRQTVEVVEHPEVMGVETVYGKMKAEMSGLDDNAIVIVSVKSEDHMVVVSSLLRLLLIDRKQRGVYLSISIPSEQIIKLLDKDNLPSENLSFIDCISPMTGRIPEEKGLTVFVENPSSLEEVGMYSDKLLMKTPVPKFVFIDSISSLLIYNTDKAVREFVHFMINKMRLDNTGGVILSTEKKEAEELVKTLVPMCDKLIRI